MSFSPPKNSLHYQSFIWDLLERFCQEPLSLYRYSVEKYGLHQKMVIVYSPDKQGFCPEIATVDHLTGDLYEHKPHARLLPKWIISIQVIIDMQTHAR